MANETLEQPATPERVGVGSKDLLAVVGEIDATKQALQPLLAKLETLNRRREKLESLAFIAAKKITRDDIQMSSGDGMPWHGTAWDFGRWMRTHACTKLWAEWNGRIYRAADLMAGRLPDMPARVDDIGTANAKAHVPLADSGRDAERKP